MTVPSAPLDTLSTHRFDARGMSAVGSGAVILLLFVLVVGDPSTIGSGKHGQREANRAVPVLESTDPTVKVPRITVSGGSKADIGKVAEALHRFSAEGLRLPDLHLRFFDDKSHCDGHFGLFQPGFSPWRIVICSSESFVIPHELAHAWEAANLTDRHRRGYLAERGLSTWNDPEVDRTQRGIEDVAFVIQQNLTATEVPITSPIWRERIVAYTLLTGQVSPLCSEIDVDEAPAAMRRACQAPTSS